jgi:hypothetical protein
MPRLKDIEDPCSNHRVKAFIYGDEPHARSHFHIVGPDFDFSICIESGELLQGSFPPGPTRGEVLKWRLTHLEHLRCKWKEINDPEN